MVLTFPAPQCVRVAVDGVDGVGKSTFAGELAALGMPAGAFYLGLLCVLAALGGVLALGLISDWGVIFPRWVPWLRGPIALPLAGWSYYRRTRLPR
ncbi:hypothetical protein ACLQ28_32775 [Micromonospora sp. DT201]|uniref:hypothetical protein n=1 Tax=Micromonospora sp. DT201 TaxID=3393442 RepID=UPI003CF411C5